MHTDFQEQCETHGIVLAAYDLKEADRLIHLFSEQYGLLKLILPRGNRVRSRLHPLSEALVEGEFLFHPGKGELFRCLEGRVVRSSLRLRHSLPCLEAALEMVQAVRRSQFLWKPAPLLYKIFSTYLSRLPSAESPEGIASSFYLKLLKHEGHLHLTMECPTCNEVRERHVFCDGELYCPLHAPYGGVTFSQEEGKRLVQLAEERQLSTLLSLSVNETLREKIRLLFGVILEEKTNAKGGI